MLIYKNKKIKFILEFFIYNLLLFSHSVMSNSFAIPRTVAYQAPLAMGLSRQESWSGLPFPSPGDLSDPGIEPGSPVLWADALPSEPPVWEHKRLQNTYWKSQWRRLSGEEDIWAVVEKMCRICQVKKFRWGCRRNNVSETINLLKSLVWAGNTKEKGRVPIREWCKWHQNQSLSMECER